jgi:hypothetical protein
MITKQQHLVKCHESTGCLGGGNGQHCDTCVIWVRFEYPVMWRFVLFLRGVMKG